MNDRNLKKRIESCPSCQLSYHNSATTLNLKKRIESDDMLRLLGDDLGRLNLKKRIESV